MCVCVYLLYCAFLLDLALSQLLQQHQLGLLQPQLLLQLFDDALPLLRAALLDTAQKKYTLEPCFSTCGSCTTVQEVLQVVVVGFYS